MARLGRIRVTYDLLEELLGLPERAIIERVTHDELFHRSFEIIVRSGDLPIVAEGAEIPVVQYSVTRIEGEFQT